MKYAVIDIETTGLDCFRHEIIEIAIVTPNERYHAKVIPERIDYADKKALEMNGYSAKEWSTAIPSKDVAIRTARILDGCIIIGHNPSFDMGFLRELWDLYNCNPYIDRRYIDTVCLAREHLPKCRSYKLDHIREYLGWSKLANHTSLVDCEDTERLFFALWRCSIWKRWYYRFRFRFVSWLGRSRL
jgi:DNA polymerase-3 subunit epsilon